jgi:hypothetical protein
MAPLLPGRLHRRASRFAPLVPVPPVAELPEAKLQAAARYLGTLDEQGSRVVGQSLAARSAARLSLSAEALDVVRIAGSFRIPAAALRGASTAERFDGKPVRDLLLVRWVHDEHRWQTGFRLEPSKALDRRDRRATTRPPDVGAWVRTISKMARSNEGAQ